jgi:hypothetical protein
MTLTAGRATRPDRRTWRAFVGPLMAIALLAGCVPSSSTSTASGVPPSPSGALVVVPETPSASVGPSLPISGGRGTPTPRPTGPTDTPAPQYPLFGMSGHLMWHSEQRAIAELDMLQADGLHIVRFDASWKNLEPRRGEYAYLTKLDAIVDAANARDIHPVITVVETPGWANGGRGTWVPPDDPQDYARFVGALAARYAGRVLGWEIWNEPDLKLFWQPSPSPLVYARMLVAASKAVRAADPAALVVGGSVTFGNTNFLDAMYDAGVQGTFDALAVHPYTLTQSPDATGDRYHSFTAILDDMRATLTARGDGGIPLWITEFGWAVVGANSVSADKRVAYLQRTVELVRARPWVQVLAIYTIDVEDSARYGLSNNGVRSPAWRAYVAAVRDG